MKFKTRALAIIDNKIQITASEDVLEDIKNLISYIQKGKMVTVEIKRERRSENANSYLWVLLQKLALKISQNGTPVSKEWVYRKFIKESMNYTEVVVSTEALESFQRKWSRNGLGFVSELAEINGDNAIVHIYYGSSTYDSKEMSRLIDFVVEECKQLGIETKSPSELASMIREWEKRGGNNG